jgi:hypothetical protein
LARDLRSRASKGIPEEPAKDWAYFKAVIAFVEKDKTACPEAEQRAHFIHESDPTLLIRSRRNELVEAIGSEEVLLINKYYHLLCFDGKENPARVIEEGSDETFRQYKERLISSELGLKDTFLRLSGIGNMIIALGRMDEDSELRRSLWKKSIGRS